VLLRLAYLTVTTMFAALRLLPASDRDKDTEILALRHQIAVLERQLGAKKSGSPHQTGLCWRRCCTGSRCTAAYEQTPSKRASWPPVLIRDSSWSRRLQ
jgi:hypothetical protein